METSLKQKAYTIIKSKILSCEYAPNMLLNEEFLCKEINASRTPIRDALSRLEQENLVIIMPKKGVLVAPLAVNEINTIYETRILLEPYILATYGTRITKEIFQRMQVLIASLNLDDEECVANDVNRYYESDKEYHHIIVGLCENKYLIQCYQDIFNNDLRLRILSGKQTPQRLFEARQEHLQIQDEIMKRNYAKAAEVLKQHLLSSKEAFFKLLMSSSYSVSG